MNAPELDSIIRGHRDMSGLGVMMNEALDHPARLLFDI